MEPSSGRITPQGRGDAVKSWETACDDRSDNEMQGQIHFLLTASEKQSLLVETVWSHPGEAWGFVHEKALRQAAQLAGCAVVVAFRGGVQGVAHYLFLTSDVGLTPEDCLANLAG